MSVCHCLLINYSLTVLSDIRSQMLVHTELLLLEPESWLEVGVGGVAWTANHSVTETQDVDDLSNTQMFAPFLSLL